MKPADAQALGITLPASGVIPANQSVPFAFGKVDYQLTPGTLLTARYFFFQNLSLSNIGGGLTNNENALANFFDDVVISHLGFPVILRDGRLSAPCAVLRAADPYLAAVLVGIGVTSLSMAPVALAEVRGFLATIDRATCLHAADMALAAASAEEARHAVKHYLEHH